jgi:hypothetical protein
MFAKNVLDTRVARLYSEAGQGGANVTSFSPDRRGKEVQIYDDNHHPREG